MPKKISARELSDSALELIAARFKVLSEVNRLKLIIALEEGERNVTELVKDTGLTQANVSRHLQTLSDAGILHRRKEGPSVIYAIADRSIFDMCEHVCGSVQKQLQNQSKVFGASSR